MVNQNKKSVRAAARLAASPRTQTSAGQGTTVMTPPIFEPMSQTQQEKATTPPVATTPPIFEPMTQQAAKPGQTRMGSPLEEISKKMIDTQATPPIFDQGGVTQRPMPFRKRPDFLNRRGPKNIMTENVLL